MKRFLYVALIVAFCIVSYWVYTILSAPMVSVILPVYNGNKNGWLDRSISSILNQTYKDLELILIDDGSTDDSWEVLKKYAAQDKRIRLYKNKENMGISKTRNRGNDLALGKYIIPMDQDDDNDPNRILFQVAHMEQNPWLTVSIMGTITTNGNPLASVYEEDWIKFSLFISNFIGHPNTMIRHSFLKKNHIRYNPGFKCASDYDLFLQILEHKGHFARMHINLFKYNGPNYSKKGNGPCDIDVDVIREKWLHLDEADYVGEKLICTVAKRVNSQIEYKRQLSPGFIDVLIQRYCSKVEVQQ